LSEAEADTFAGLWIEHAPAFKVVALFTEDGGTKLSRFVQGGPLERLSEARPAARPLRQLLDDARAIRGGGVAPFDLSIDVKRNMIEIRVESIDAFDRWASANSIALPPSADIRRVEAIARPAANIYGGLSLTVQGCTSGFSVRKAGTGDGITTAGHCGNTGVYNGTNLPFQGEALHDTFDIQWHTTPGYTDQNWIKWQPSGTTRSITGRVFWVNQPIGATICKYGKTTEYDCGEITAKNIALGFVPSSDMTFIQAHRAGVDLTEGGDSGGPVFVSGEAWGTICASSGTGLLDTVYMAEDYIETGLNVTVKTSP
jgi:hypothetical protein